VPLTVAIVGGSGSRSMAEKRNANAHSVKEETFEGDSEVGSSNDMVRGYAVPTTAPRDRRRTRRAPTRRPRRGLERAEVAESGERREVAVGEGGHHGPAQGGGHAGLVAHGDGDRAGDQGEVAEGLVGRAVAYTSPPSRAALQGDGAVVGDGEAVLDVGPQRIAVQRGEGRLGRVVCRWRPGGCRRCHVGRRAPWESGLSGLRPVASSGGITTGS